MKACERCGKSEKVCACREGGSVNSLGAIPSGRLRKKKKPKVKRESAATGLLDVLKGMGEA